MLMRQMYGRTGFRTTEVVGDKSSGAMGATRVAECSFLIRWWQLSFCWPGMHRCAKLLFSWMNYMLPSWHRCELYCSLSGKQMFSARLHNQWFLLEPHPAKISKHHLSERKKSCYWDGPLSFCLFSHARPLIFFINYKIRLFSQNGRNVFNVDLKSGWSFTAHPYPMRFVMPAWESSYKSIWWSFIVKFLDCNYLLQNLISNHDANVFTLQSIGNILKSSLFR